MSLKIQYFRVKIVEHFPVNEYKALRLKEIEILI